MMYRIAALILMAVFYCYYFLKMIIAKNNEPVSMRRAFLLKCRRNPNFSGFESTSPVIDIPCKIREDKCKLFYIRGDI